MNEGFDSFIQAFQDDRKQVQNYNVQIRLYLEEIIDSLSLEEPSDLSTTNDLYKVSEGENFCKYFTFYLI